MEGLVIFIIIVALICSGISSAWTYLATHPSEVSVHLEYWRQLYVLGSYLAYVGLISAVTPKEFQFASNPTLSPAWTARIGRFILRPLAACLGSGGFLLISMWLERVLHLSPPNWPFRLTISIFAAILFTTWPTACLRLVFYLILLIHIRTVYLVLASIILLATIAVMITGALLIILTPIAVYCAIGFYLYGLTIRVEDYTWPLILTVIGIALFVTTARPTWRLVRRMIDGPIQRIREFGSRLIDEWRAFTVSSYAAFSRAPAYFGGLFGGDVT